MIIDHTQIKYASSIQRNNGAYHYSREIVKYFIPNIKTDRNWITIKVGEKCLDYSIYFIHNNLNPDRYEFIKNYKDVILVCGIPETCEKVAHLGTPIYLPLSVDVSEVDSYRSKTQKGTCYAGRQSKRLTMDFSRVRCVENMPRGAFLRTMGQYEKVYAVGRTAIEAKILGCEVLPYDERFPDPSVWEVLDSREAAKILQEKLNVIDGKGV